MKKSNIKIIIIIRVSVSRIIFPIYLYCQERQILPRLKNIIISFILFIFLTWLYLRFTYLVRKKKYAHSYYKRGYKNNHLKPPGLQLKNMKKRFKEKKKKNRNFAARALQANCFWHLNTWYSNCNTGGNYFENWLAEDEKIVLCYCRVFPRYLFYLLLHSPSTYAFTEKMIAVIHINLIKNNLFFNMLSYIFFNTLNKQLF